MNEDILKQNKLRNVAAMDAHLKRMGISRPLARSIDELVQIEGKNPLIESAQNETA